MIDYQYKKADFVNKTDADLSESSVLKMLFEGTAASGEPAINFEVSNIESVSDPIESLKISEVVVEEVSDDKVVFTVRSPSTSVTAPAGSTKHDTRVCHEDDIPYHYYDIALVN